MNKKRKVYQIKVYYLGKDYSVDISLYGGNRLIPEHILAGQIRIISRKKLVFKRSLDSVEIDRVLSVLNSLTFKFLPMEQLEIRSETPSEIEICAIDFKIIMNNSHSNAENSTKIWTLIESLVEIQWGYWFPVV